jgi:limonene-1,2-epoxide hydrolase
MESSPNLVLVQSFLDRLKTLDVDRVLELTTPDIEYQNVPLPPDRGQETVGRTLRMFTRVLTQYESRLHNIAESNGVVLTERTDVLRGPLLDLDFWVAGTFEVRDGKIAVWRDRFDLATVALQFVASPLRKLLQRALAARQQQ